MNKLFIEHSIGVLIEKCTKKKLSPRDLKETALSNINELDQKYLAWVTYGGEQKRGLYDVSYTGAPRLLENIPVGVKDIYNTADFPTQMGSPLWKNFTPGNDARAVFNLKRQGAVVVGKTVTAEFAVHALDSTRNPYDDTKTPGTSSSGSAVAVALGMVPLATGSQTAGSIVRPASFCGVYGCKPSFGTIPRTGTLKTTDSLDTLGFFVLHAEDLRRGFDAMRIKGLDYPTSHAALSDAVRQSKEKGKPWRVAFVKTHTWEHVPKYAQGTMEKFIADLSKIPEIEVKEAFIPTAMEKAHDIHATIYNKTLSYYFKGEYKKSDFVSPIMNELIAAGNSISLSDYKQAIQEQDKLIRGMDSFFSDYDVLISLSTAGEAPLREDTELPDPALMWTLTHLPVVSVPQFLSPKGLPFGFQVAARKYNDYRLFSFLDHLRFHDMIPEAGYVKKIYG